MEGEATARIRDESGEVFFDVLFSFERKVAPANRAVVIWGTAIAQAFLILLDVKAGLVVCSQNEINGTAPTAYQIVRAVAVALDVLDILDIKSHRGSITRGEKLR